MSKDREDGKASQQRCEGVGNGDDGSVAVHVVAEVVVGGEHCDGAEADAQREEGLGHCCVPHLGSREESN